MPRPARRAGEGRREVKIVSACLAGFPCRYDGAAKSDPRVMALVRSGGALPVCPEQLGGLPTPREPSEIVGGRVLSRDGRDLTEAFGRGARATLDLARAYGCDEAILKARSPSCGKGLVHDGRFGDGLVEGDGLAAALLASEGVRVRTEEDPWE